MTRSRSGPASTNGTRPVRRYSSQKGQGVGSASTKCFTPYCGFRAGTTRWSHGPGPRIWRQRAWKTSLPRRAPSMSVCSEVWKALPPTLMRTITCSGMAVAGAGLLIAAQL